MKAPVSWLRDFVVIPADATGRDVAELLLKVGFEVEGVDSVGDVQGPLVVGRVISIEELPDLKKPIRWCQVEVGAAHGNADTPGIRGIVCGARNFAEGDLVVVALPGTTLPGDFTIATRKTYGQISDGMICSAREIGLGDEHDGIIILPADSATPGDDAFPILGLGDQVLDIAVTPDRGYALSIRGLARELSIALGVEMTDPGQVLAELPAAAGEALACASDDTQACDLFVLQTLTGFDPKAPTPDFIKSRLAAVGVRSISLAVDVTNYVMFELGQPLHAFDADKISGTVRARRAVAGEKLETLDHVTRELVPDDLVIADDSGALSLAGTMGGLASEITDATTRIAIESAHFDPVVVARMSRRHKLSSESSRRFERGVDRMLAPIAAARVAELLISFGGAEFAGSAGVETAPAKSVIEFDPALPSRIAGHTYSQDLVKEILIAVGCTVTESAGAWAVTPPSWRPDLIVPIDLVEEIVRIDGFDNVPTRLPVAPKGRGLTQKQRLQRRAGLHLAGRGLVEVRNYPFVGVSELDALELAQDDVRRNALRLANSLSDEQPLMRTTLLPGLLTAVTRNISRGSTDVALYEIASVSLLRVGQSANGGTNPPRPEVNGRPNDSLLSELEALLPDQPLHFAAVLTGATSPAGWWGSAANYSWRDAITAVLNLGLELGVVIDVEAGVLAPWHPGRCASLSVNGVVIGHAGELSPRVLENLGLPKRAVALEIHLDVVLANAQSVASAPTVNTFPVAKEDIALIVADAVAAKDVLATIKDAAGELLEDVRLFDVYQGAQIGEGNKSLAFAMRFRASDRTLSSQEVAEAREGAIAAAQKLHGATLRG